MIRVMTALILAGTMALAYGASYADDDEEDCAEEWVECMEDAVDDYRDCVDECMEDDDEDTDTDTDTENSDLCEDVGGGVNKRNCCIRGCECTRGGDIGSCECDARGAGCLTEFLLFRCERRVCLGPF